MQMVIDIPEQLVANLEARGVETSGYLKELLADAAMREDERAQGKVSGAELDRFFDEMARYSDKIPPLPARAFTRESFYEDQD